VVRNIGFVGLCYWSHRVDGAGDEEEGLILIDSEVGDSTSRSNNFLSSGTLRLYECGTWRVKHRVVNARLM